MNNPTEPNPWKRSPQDNFELKAAFPSGLRNDVLAALSALPENPNPWTSFRVHVENETLSVPYRIYHDVSLLRTDRLSTVQEQMLACLLTRHHDGFIREKHLNKIIAVNAAWQPPFVVQLVGEYLIEIIRVIEENLAALDKSLYRSFLRLNPEFWALTQRRVVSYWDCYYRSHRKDTYPGFRVLDFFRRVQESDAG
jgi:hypothetical protein